MKQITNELYINSRYPGELGILPNRKLTIEEAKEFYKFAMYVYEKVEENLSDIPNNDPITQ